MHRFFSEFSYFLLIADATIASLTSRHEHLKTFENQKLNRVAFSMN